MTLEASRFDAGPVARVGENEVSSLQLARQRYFEANGFGDDGGYDKKWVFGKIGPIPFAIPNTAGRAVFVRYHDLHHLVTGYATDLPGEVELGAWELAGGCINRTALVISLAMLSIGLTVAPVRAFHAFVRGRRTRNLFSWKIDDDLLSRSLGDVRGQLGLSPCRSYRAGVLDCASFALWSTVATVQGLCTTALIAAPLIGVLYLVLA